MPLIKDNTEQRNVGYGSPRLPNAFNTFTKDDTLAEVLTDGYFNILLPSIAVNSLLYMVIEGSPVIELRVSEITTADPPVVKVVEYHGVASNENDFSKLFLSFAAPLFSNFLIFTYKVEITGLSVIVTEALSGTEDGTVTAKKGFGLDFTPAPPHLIIPLSSPVGSQVSTPSLTAFFTGNNILQSGDALEIVPAKATPGGQLDMQVFYKRVH